MRADLQKRAKIVYQDETNPDKKTPQLGEGGLHTTRIPYHTDTLSYGDLMTDKQQKSQERAQYHKDLMDWFFGLKPKWHVRPAYFAYKTAESQIEWVERIDDQLYRRISRDNVKNALVDQSINSQDPELHLTYRVAGDIMMRIESVLQGSNHIQYHSILIDEPAAYRFQDQDYPCYHVIDFDYVGHPSTYDLDMFWNLFYADLNLYWRGKLEQMVDYDAQRNRSKHFERLLMCIAQLFADNEPVKAMPYIHGPGDAGKTTFLNDIGALFGDSYLPNMQWQNLGTSYGIMNLRGKRLVHVDEAPKGEMSDLHKLVTGASAYLQGRQVYRAPEVFKNSAMIWITSNHAPLIGNESALLARYRPIELGPINETHSIESKERRVRLMREQLPMMIAAGLSLLQDNDCAIPQVTGDEKVTMDEDYFETIDSFINRHFQQNSFCYIERGDLTRFCKRMHFDVKKVVARMQVLFPDAKTDERVRMEGRRPRIIRGVALRNNDEIMYHSIIQSYRIDDLNASQ